MKTETETETESSVCSAPCADKRKTCSKSTYDGDPID